MTPPNYAFPVFTVENLQKAKTFYCENFGFSAIFEVDWYIQLLSSTGIQLAFMLPGHPTQPEIFQKSYNGEGVIFSFDVDDVDSVYAEAKNLSMDIIFELTSEDWGQRHFSIRDPNGIYIDIFQMTEPAGEYDQS